MTPLTTKLNVKFNKKNNRFEIIDSGDNVIDWYLNASLAFTKVLELNHFR